MLGRVAELRHRALDGGVQQEEEGRDVGVWVWPLFALQRSSLILGQPFAFGVGEEAIRAAGQVTELKMEGWRPPWTGEELLFGEAGADQPGFFTCLNKGVRRRLKEG